MFPRTVLDDFLGLHGLTYLEVRKVSLDPFWELLQKLLGDAGRAAGEPK